MEQFSFKKSYLNQNEFALDLASQSKYYDATAFDLALRNNTASEYAALVYFNKDTNLDTASSGLITDADYKYLDTNDKLIALQTAFGGGDARNYEYLVAKIDEAKDYEIYQNANFLEKAGASVIGLLGTAASAIYNTLEGVVDAGAGFVNMFVQDDSITEWIAQDFTGAGAFTDSVEQFKRRYSWLDKTTVGQVLDDAVYSITQMSALLIPGVGTAVFAAGIAGNAMEEAAQYSVANDKYISPTELFVYGAEIAATEFAIERITMGLGKATGVDKLLFGKSAASAMGKNVAEATAKGNTWTLTARKIMGDSVGEGFEEAITEITQSIIWCAQISGNWDDISSPSDILYAAILGGLVSSGITGTHIAKQGRLAVTKSGDVKFAKDLTEAELKNAAVLNKTQSLLLSDSLRSVSKSLQKERDYVLEIKTQGGNVEEGWRANAKQDAQLVQSTLGLSQFLGTIGVENFNKAGKLLNNTIQDQANLIRTFATRNSIENRRDRLRYEAIIKEFESRHPGETIKVNGTTVAERKLQQLIKDKFGVDVLFVTPGSQNGISSVIDGMAIGENTIVIRSGLIGAKGLNATLEVVKHELVHTLQFESGIITSQSLLAVKRCVNDRVTNKTTDTKPIPKGRLLEAISESQAEALTTQLLFDNVTAERVLNHNRNLFFKVYNWMSDLAAKWRNSRKNADGIRFSVVAHRMSDWRKVVAKNIGNEEEANYAIKQMSLTADEAKDLVNTYVPNWWTEKYKSVELDYDTGTLSLMVAENILEKSRKSDDGSEFDYGQVFNPEYYTTEFIDSLNKNDMKKGFVYAVKKAVMKRTGYCPSEYGLIDTRNLVNDFNDKLINLCIKGDITEKDWSGFDTLFHLLNHDTKKRFISNNKTCDAANIPVVFQFTENGVSGVEYLHDTKTIVITMPRNYTSDKLQYDDFVTQLSDAASMAIADTRNLYANNIDKAIIESSLSKLAPERLSGLGKTLLTKNEYNEIVEKSASELAVTLAPKVKGLTVSQRNAVMSDKNTPVGFLFDGQKLKGFGTIEDKAFDFEVLLSGRLDDKLLNDAVDELSDSALTEVYKRNNKLEGQMNFFGELDKPVEQKQPQKEPEKQKYEPLEADELEFETPTETEPAEVVSEPVQDEVQTAIEELHTTDQTIKESIKEVTGMSENATSLIKSMQRYKFGDYQESRVQGLPTREAQKTIVSSSKRWVAEFGARVDALTDEEVNQVLDFVEKTDLYTVGEDMFAEIDMMLNQFNTNASKYTPETRERLTNVLRTNLSAAGRTLGLRSHYLAQYDQLRSIRGRYYELFGLEVAIPEDTLIAYNKAGARNDTEMQSKIERMVLQDLEPKLREIRGGAKNINFLAKGLTKEERRRRLNNFADKITAIRYLAMLSNPATHLTNIWSNTLIKGLGMATDGFTRMLENRMDDADSYYIDENGKKIRMHFRYTSQEKPTKEELDAVESQFGIYLDTICDAGKYDYNQETPFGESTLLRHMDRKTVFSNEILKRLDYLINDVSLGGMDRKFTKPELLRAFTEMLKANFPEQLKWSVENYDPKFKELREKALLVDEYRYKIQVEVDIARNQLNADDKTLSESERALRKEHLSKLQELATLKKQILDYTSLKDEDIENVLEKVMNSDNSDGKLTLIRDALVANHAGKRPLTYNAIQEQLDEQAKKIEKDGISAEITMTMLEVATRRVMERYLRYDNRVYKFWNSIANKNAITKILFSAPIPFARVVTNIAAYVCRHSPFTLARGIVNTIRVDGMFKDGIPKEWKDNIWTSLFYGVKDPRFLKAQAQSDIATGAAGTILMLVGVVLDSLGIIGIDDDDEYNGYVVNIGGIKLRLSDLAPAATPILFGAALTRGMREGQLAGMFEAFETSISEYTMIGSFDNLLEYNDSVFAIVGNSLGTYFTQYVPAVLRSLQKVIDSPRKVDYNAGFFSTTLQRVISGIPFLSRVLPAKIDGYTGENEQAYNSKWLAILNIVSPIKFSASKTDPLLLAGREYGVTLDSATGKFTINGTDYSLSGRDLENFQRARGKLADTLGNDFMNDKLSLSVKTEEGTYETKVYSEMTDAERKNALENLRDKLTQYNKISWWVSSGHTYQTNDYEEYKRLRSLGINATYKKKITGSKYKD